MPVVINDFEVVPPRPQAGAANAPEDINSTRAEEKPELDDSLRQLRDRRDRLRAS